MKSQGTPTASRVLPDGTIVEMVFDAADRQTSFAVYSDETWNLESTVTLPGGEQLVPYSPDNNLIEHKVVLLPSVPEEYGSEAELLATVRDFIHRYVDVSPLFEEIASYYVRIPTKPATHSDVKAATDSEARRPPCRSLRRAGLMVDRSGRLEASYGPLSLSSFLFSSSR